MTQVLGFRFSGMSAGIKKSGAPDLALLVCDEPCTAAAVFTRNLVRAHPVTISEKRVLTGRAQACLVNSGNANACNGQPGLEGALSTTQKAAELLKISPELVLPSSTGVIGQPFPKDKIEAALPALVDSLSEDGLDAFADAIMTTDRWRKIASTTIESDGKTATLVAVGKGAGMFHPDLAPAGELPQPNGDNFDGGDYAGLHATMLVYILTDAAADVDTLKMSLMDSADVTFNAATVDGDTSTNDSVYLFASGKSGLVVGHEQLTKALLEVCRPLAKSMVLDGEGAEHAVTITVRGLNNDAEARDVARVIATSPLVKTAITGKDANWGRLLAAAGRSGVPFDPSSVTLNIEGVCICDRGLPTSAEADREATQKMQAKEYGIELILGKGPGTFSYITSDLGHGYVDVNAGYRT